MKMKRCLSASILLMLSLEAALLVAGHPFDAAAAADVVGAIRLPSDTEVAAARPWKCCDAAICTKSLPPICRCADEVERCAATCKRCEPSASNPSRRVCKDQYIGDPGPKCRPWKCCDAAICTKSLPPICRCADEVERCAATCKRCVQSTRHPVLSVCKDQYIGDPGPICRPWECCDVAPCTRSIPPICRCVDEVDQCAPTCQSCAASTSDPSRHVCEDIYRGFPGPMCTPRAGGN